MSSKNILNTLLILTLSVVFFLPTTAYAVNACLNPGQPCVLGGTNNLCNPNTECAPDSIVRPKSLPADNLSCALSAPAFRGGNFGMCIYGFATRESANNYRSISECERKSSFVGNTTFCLPLIDRPQEIDLSILPDSFFNFDPIRGWYTCYSLQGIDNSIYQLGTRIVDKRDGSQICHVSAWLGNNTTACDANDLCNTALGTISTNIDGVKNFFGDILKFLIGISGGLALMLYLYAIFITTTSGADQKKLGLASEIFNSVTAGLLFMIFSIVLLKIIGVDILSIPGLK